MENKTKIDKLANLILVCSVIVSITTFGVALWQNRHLCDPHYDFIGWLFGLMFVLSGIVIFASLSGFIFAVVNKENSVKFTLSFFISVLLFSFSLMSVNTTKCPAPDAAIKSNVEGARVAAKLWYDNPDNGNYSYDNVCHSPYFQRISSAISGQKSAMRCFSSKEAYCAEADLVRSKGQWCADSIGYAGPEANCSADNISCQ